MRINPVKKNQNNNNPRLEKTFSSLFKAKVALKALKGEKSFAELEEYFNVPAPLIEKWAKEVKKNIK